MPQHRYTDAVIFSAYVGSDGQPRAAIVSRFAATQFAIKSGPDAIINLANVLHHDNNPSMTGWLFEMWFFASLRNGGINSELTMAAIRRLSGIMTAIAAGKHVAKAVEFRRANWKRGQ